MNNSFDFGKAISQPFQSEDGRAFALRLLFWVAGPMAIINLVFIPFYGKAYPALLEYNWLNFQAIMGNGSEPDPMIVFQNIGSIAWIYVLHMFALMATFAMGEAALHRKILFNQEYARRPIGFGRQEWLVLTAQISIWMLYLFGIMALTFIISFLGVALGVAIPVIGGLIILLGVFSIFAFMIYFPVRLAPAAALSVQDNSLHVLTAKTVTKGRFWKLIGPYLVLWLIGYTAVSLVMSLGIWAVSGQEDMIIAMSGMSEENPRLLFETMYERLKNPIVMLIGILFIIVYTAICVLWYLCISGVATYATKLWGRK